MPKLLTLDCPRCGTKSVAFTVRKEHFVKNNAWTSYTMRRHTISEKYSTCNICNYGVIVTFVDELFRSVVPETNLSTPLHLPDKVKRFFEQGTGNMETNWDAAGSMFRKALDVSLKEKFPQIHGNLIKRIKNAASQNLLTQDLADWADQIRLEGNAAVHEDEPFSKEQAIDLASFTDLVLRYMFTLPQMLKDARDSTEAQPKEIDGD